MHCLGEPFICSPPPCNIYRVRYGIHFLLVVRLTFVLFQMSQLRAAKRVCKNPGTKAYYLTKSCNDVARREWLYHDFVFGDELTRGNILKIAVTADELREVNVYEVCVQPLDGVGLSADSRGGSRSTTRAHRRVELG